MPRLPREEVLKREEWVLQLFRKEPTLSIPKATERVRQHFGDAMRTKRLYALRAVATGAAPEAAKATSKGGKKDTSKAAPKQAAPSQVMQAGRNPAADAQGLPTLLPITNQSYGDFLASALDSLREKGLTNLRVGHKADSYVVIEAAS